MLVLKVVNKLYPDQGIEFFNPHVVVNNYDLGCYEVVINQMELYKFSMDHKVYNKFRATMKDYKSYDYIALVFSAQVIKEIIFVEGR